MIPKKVTVSPRLWLPQRRATATFSTTPNAKAADNAPQQSSSSQQPFVQTRIRPGEWDPKTRTNPLYRPRWRPGVKIWSGDDFANRPTVGFSGEFESLADAATTLSFLYQADQAKIYQLYCDILESSSSGSPTSHEYVVRVVAQKFHLTPERVAAVVQLQHNEQQLIRQQQKGDTSVRLLTEAADYMDTAIQQEIDDVYNLYNLKKPDSFVEDPAFLGAGQESKHWTVVDDLLDVDHLTKEADAREFKEAQRILDEYVYIEDVEDDKVDIPLSKDSRKLMNAANRMQSEQQQSSSSDDDIFHPLPKEGERRDRWKFVAQIVNTRELRRQKKGESRSYTNNSPINTIVEHNGHVRPATREEVKQTAWKPTRHICEHIYENAKKGWLDRQNHGNAEAWGKAPPMAAKVVEQPVEEVPEEASAPDDTSDSSSDSSDSDSSEEVDSKDDEKDEPSKDEEK